MFGNRHQFDMRVAHVLDVGHQVGRQFAVGVETAVRVAFPRTGMDFVNVDRAMQPVPLAALLHPFRILPLMPVGGGGECCRAGAQFITLRIGVGFGQHLAGFTIAYLIAVQRILP